MMPFVSAIMGTIDDGDVDDVPVTTVADTGVPPSFECRERLLEGEVVPPPAASAAATGVAFSDFPISGFVVVAVVGAVSECVPLSFSCFESVVSVCFWGCKNLNTDAGNFGDDDDDDDDDNE